MNIFDEGTLVWIRTEKLDFSATVILDTGGPTIRVKSVGTSIEYDIPRKYVTAL